MLTSVFSEATVVAAGEGRKLWVGSGLYTLLVEGDDTNGRYALVDLRVEPGDGTPPHIHHAEDEMFYILEGELALWADGNKTVAGPGAFVYVPMGVVHAFKNESGSAVRFLCGMTPAGFEQFFVAIGTPVSAETPAPPPVGPEFGEKIVRLAPEFHMEIVS